MKRLIIIAIIMGMFGCATEDDDGQDFGNIFDSPEGLILTEEEHPDGWGREDCFACHPITAIHRGEPSDDPSAIPLDAIQEIVEESGLESCSFCHGDNGVFE